MVVTADFYLVFCQVGGLFHWGQECCQARNLLGLGKCVSVALR